MADSLGSATMEIVRLPNGRYTVKTIGASTMDDDAGEFATQAEAEDWMFDRAQEREAEFNDIDVIKPGSGQGIA
jgi:hypothetical protein